MSATIIELSRREGWRVLVAHQRADVRHALRTLIEASNIAVAEVADGEKALSELEFARFDLLVLELDLPGKDGITVMQLHRVLLAHERTRVAPPAVILTLPPEVRGNATLTDHLRTLGVAAVIDDAPRPEVASVVESVLRERAAQLLDGKPAVA